MALTSTMSITDRVNIFTNNYEDVNAEPLWNQNVSVTIGGVVKQQVDSERLKITSTMRLTAQEVRNLKLVINNFAAELYYTPSEILFGRDAIEEMQVVITDPPKIEKAVYCGGIIYIVSLIMEEVLEQ